jgi:virulence-associated protein VagC
MTTAKLFKHGGSQAVRLPKDFRLDGAEVLIERRGEVVVLRPKPRLKTLADLARHMRDRFPAGADFLRGRCSRRCTPARRRSSHLRRIDASLYGFGRGFARWPTVPTRMANPSLPIGLC